MDENIIEEPQSRVKHEVPVEFVLILPRPTFGWPAIKQEGERKPKRWVKSVEVKKFNAKFRRKSKLFQTFFTCQHCLLVAKSQRSVIQYLRGCSQTETEGFECDICGKRFQKKWAIGKHMLNHLSEGNFHCSKCGYGFKSKDGMLKHLRPKKINKCAVCDIIFSCKLLLDRHRSESHGNVFKCDICSYQTKIENDFMRHKKTHNKSFACDTCLKNFSTDQSLDIHQRQHRHGIYATAPEETFDCDKCDKWYLSLRYLQLHQTSHNKNDNEVKCEVCNNICKNRKSLRNHRQNHDIVKVECSICRKAILKRLLSSHMRIHSVESPFKRELCEYSTKTKRQLKEHIEGIHLLRKLVDASKCWKIFCDFELLEKLQLRHGSSATTCEKKFKCDKCHKAFFTPRHLKQHKIQVHVGKLVECEICKKKLRQHRLKSHMKFHSPGNHFECDLCDYKFEKKDKLEKHVKVRRQLADFKHLTEHQKIHIGKNLWKCTPCDYQTTYRSHLLAHMTKKKHKMSS